MSKAMESRVLMYINENYCPNIFGTVNVNGKVFDFVEEDEVFKVGGNPTPDERTAVEMAVKVYEKRDRLRPLPLKVVSI